MNILFVAYESDGLALCRLAQRFQDDGHAVKQLQGDYYSFIDADWIHDYFECHGFEAWTDFSEEYADLYRTEPTVDYDRLERFEDRYCVNKNLHQLVLSDPILARHHHERKPYYTPIDSRERLYFWVQKLLRWVQTEVESFDPDLIFTMRRNYFVKNVVAQLAMATGIPMLTLVRSRVGSYCHLTRHFGYGADPDAREYVEGDPPVSRARSYAEQFVNDEEGGLYDARSQRRTRRERLFTVGEVLGDLLGDYLQQAKKTLLREKRKYRGPLRANYFNSHAPRILRFRTRNALDRLRYLAGDRFERSVPDRPFVYVPLHTLPESATLTLSTEYFEDDLVRFMSKELPAGMVLGVKENPNMVGVRSRSFYDALEAIPNVRLVDPTVPSKRLLDECRGVAGISGTALLEGALFGRPTHCFGLPEFLDVVDHRGHGAFDEFVDACVRDEPSDGRRRALRYVQYVFDAGREVPLRDLRTRPESEAFEEGLDTVHSMLADAVREGPPRPVDPEAVARPAAAGGR